MILDEFIAQNDGKFVEKEDSSALNQCMDLAFAWCDKLGIDRTAIRHSAAYLVWTQPNDLTLANFDYIPNTPNGLPQAGDLVVWSSSYGGAGHIGIATGRSNLNSFDCFERNDPLKSPCHTKTYGYDFVLGWLRPKVLINTIPVLKTDFESMRTKCDILQKFIDSGYNSIDDVTIKVNSLNDQLQSSTAHVNQLESQLTVLEQQFSDYRAAHPVISPSTPTTSPQIGYNYNDSDILLTIPKPWGIRVIRYVGNGNK